MKLGPQAAALKREHKIAGRYVTLGDGRKIGLGKYVAAWKACKALRPGDWIGKGVDGWGQTAGEALASLRAGMTDRINKQIPGYGVGRKWSPEWYWPMARAAADLNGRVMVRWLPADLMKIPKFKERVEYARAA